MRIPVIGVFYNEIGHFHDWLASVEAQKTSEVDPVPVIVISRHRQFVDQLAALVHECASKNRIDSRNIEISSDNVGPTVGFNRGAQGFMDRNPDCPWIASLDPDARFAPEAIQQMLLAGNCRAKIGMVSPIIVRPRVDGDYFRPIAAVESVCQAGHHPSQPVRPSAILTNYWQSHFKDWTVEDVCAFLASHPECAPFCACFCASLWSAEMLKQIRFPDKLQFRTLNCGEIGYRAQLSGWSSKFAPRAFAFHRNPPDENYSRNRAIAENGSLAWYYYHAQGLIALKYFPDDLRNVAARRGDQTVPWQYYFPDLEHIESCADAPSRQSLYERWREFDLRH